MDKYEFISRLTKALGSISDEERSEALSYYKELIEDAGSENESDLIEHLGSPESIAESIILESGTVAVRNSASDQNASSAQQFGETAYNNSTAQQPQTGDNAPKYREVTRDGGTIVLLIIVAILTSPFWIAAFGTIFGLLVGLVATVFAVAFALCVSGIACFAAGIATLFEVAPIGLMLMGGGVILFSLTLMAAVPLCKGVVKLCIAAFRGLVKLLRSFIYKKEVVA